jgi:hypothetical protein
MSRFKVTIRGDGTEVRGYATPDALVALGSDTSDPYVVIVSAAEDDFDPFVDMAEKVAAVLDLADEAEAKGRSLQQVPEMRLVGNAYVGMAQRIREAMS